MIDYLHHLSDESMRFNRAVSAIDRPGDGGAALAGATAPSCAEWSAADLTWHLAEVQYFWGSILEGGLTDHSQVVRLERPPDEALVALQRVQGERLSELLTGRDPDEPCWSWHPAGKSVGWVLRRQAHESLIHRVDAELAAVEAGVGELGPVDETLAADGVDELLNVMMNVVATDDLGFEPGGSSVRLIAPEQTWELQLGQAVGRDSRGQDIDLPAIQLGTLMDEPSTVIRADASVLDVWLWRRGTLPDDAVTGEAAVAESLNELAMIT